MVYLKEYPVAVYPLSIDTFREILSRIMLNTFKKKESNITILCGLLYQKELLLFEDKQITQWKSYTDEINTIMYLFLLNGNDLKTFERLYMESSYFINIYYHFDINIIK